MTKFFVSYSRSTKQEVGKVVALLRASGDEVWWDGDIPIIADWWSTILDNIEHAQVFIFVVSQKSVQSDYCLAELKYATDRNRPILPFLIDDHTTYTIPPEVTPIRNQWFVYDGDPARMLQQILDGTSKVQWSRHADIPVSRPPEPNTGSASIVKQFQQAVSLAEDGHFDEAIKRFRNISSLDFEEWGNECQQKIIQLNLYGVIAELAEHKSTLARARKKWDEYVEAYDADFDPLGIVAKLTTVSPLERATQEKLDINSKSLFDLFPFNFTPTPSNTPSLPEYPKSFIVEDLLPSPFEWIEIPSGKVSIEEGGYLSYEKVYKVSAFTISKYPITNAQYQIFLDSYEGYYDPQWWDFSRDAKSWRKYNPQPNETAFVGDNRPRTNICWYEAVAFCRWLSSKTELDITLPTEQQWQFAATGDSDWLYPYGNRFLKNSGNYGVGTTVVTRYPKGASIYGVMDMSGNVTEYCLNDWYTGSIGINKSLTASVVVRGGSWGLPVEFATAKARDARGTIDRYNDSGFRIVISTVGVS